MSKNLRFIGWSCKLHGAMPGAMLALPFVVPVLVHAQAVLPPEAIEQFQRVIGSRVEALTILGGDYGAAGGLYTFRGGNLADLSIAKIGGGGMVSSPRSLGVAELQWAPVLQGNIGHSWAENEFATGYLEGNRSLYDLLAVQGGRGRTIVFHGTPEPGAHD